MWRPAEVTREIAAALPTRWGSTAAGLVERSERLASQVVDTQLVDISRPIPDGVPLRRDGRPVTEGALDRMLTTDIILEEEERILALAQRWVDEEQPNDQSLPTADGLSAVQCHAAAAVEGGRRLALVVGPAGTGKTTAMRPAVAHLNEQGRACFGVAPSAAAAEVLAVETGVDADTLDKLLVEHRLSRLPQHRYDRPTGTTVIVDEAAMVPTPRLAELIHLADRRGWRLALVGDPMQFSAVGRSSMFGHLVETLGAVELDRVHRFGVPWEREASLRLRRGDTSVVDLYDQHDRFHGGTRRQMAMATVSAWWSATEAGETAAMMAPTREAVAVLNDLARAMRADAGEIDRQSPSVRLGASGAYVGDVVATRRNDRTLRTDQARMVKNRDRWTVETVHRDGAITVTGASGRVMVPAAYVAADVELAYAETSHATQGRTVDRSYLYLDGPTDTRGIYVPLTRGRTTNEAFVVLQDERAAAEVVADAVARTWVDQPATALRLDRQVQAPGRPSGSGPGPTPATARPQLEPVPATVRAPISEPDLRALVSTAVANQMDVARLQYERAGHGCSIADLTRSRIDTEEAIAQARTDSPRRRTPLMLTIAASAAVATNPRSPRRRPTCARSLSRSANSKPSRWGSRRRSLQRGRQWPEPNNGGAARPERPCAKSGRQSKPTPEPVANWLPTGRRPSSSTTSDQSQRTRLPGTGGSRPPAGSSSTGPYGRCATARSSVPARGRWARTTTPSRTTPCSGPLSTSTSRSVFTGRFRIASPQAWSGSGGRVTPPG